MFISDLHIHGRYSQATSKDLTIPNLSKWAKTKGIDLLGTGDFTHPKWFYDIKEHLTEDDSGILKTKDGFPFMLTTELSLVYSQGGKGRRIHNVVTAPDLDTVKQITDWLLTKGRVDYDGRPIFKIPCPEFVESLRSINKYIEVIPAHIWTPWFGMLGSKSGFDTVEECFLDQTKHIHAIETGLSSDPPMNWRVSQLDSYNLVSFSDLHSFWPWRVGREATIFDCDMTYDRIIKAIRTGDDLKGTVEVDPNYGKYHFDGHRKCNVCFHPLESKKHNYICPVCKKPLTVGVLDRIEQLADRSEGYVPKNAKKFYTLIPLSDIIAMILRKAVSTKGVWNQYYEILKAGKNEMDILMNVSRDDLLKVAPKEIVDAILLNREGKINVDPGYDGEYGIPRIGKEKNDHSEKKKETSETEHSQKGLGEFF
jgi:uncharacterized protein (TIGR00375 family)